MSRSARSNYGYDSPFPRRLRSLMRGDSPLQRIVPQSELAAHIGVTRQAVSFYMNGSTVPDILAFERIASFFDVSTDYLLGASEQMRTNHTDFASRSKLSTSTLDEILSLCGETNQRIAFSLMMHHPGFRAILKALIFYTRSDAKERVDDTLIGLMNELNTSVKEKSSGALTVVPAFMERQLALFNATDFLTQIFKDLAPKEQDPD